MKRMIHFKHWIGPAALLLAAAGFAALGRWQLDRAAENRALEDRFAEAAAEPVLERPAAAEAEAARYRRIRLTGEYEPGRQILLDNMTRRGQAGYEVLTPFDAGGDRLVLVNRGWLPAAPDRRLPDVSLPAAAAAVTGRIDRLPRAALTLDAAPPADDTVLVVLSYPDFEAVEAALGRPVYRFQLLLEPDARFGYRRDWGPPTDRDERNIAYAVQWFGLAALAAVIAIGMAVRARRRVPGAGA